MALVRFCISERDTAASEKVVDLMQRAGFDAPEESIDAVLTEYAHRGDTERFESFMTQILSAPPTENQRDLHVRAHIARSSLPATPSQSSLGASARFPTSALALLHRYEASGHHAPMKSYTRVISALFNVQTSPSSTSGLGRAAAHGQAWDLFAHMRYVAHPTPDAHLYALMIRACGSFTRPEPERALDLWTEMQENRIEPTKGAYEAIIRVCGRAGKEWLAEGLRLAREMGDRYSIDGISGRRLWCALLEGCKRAGDLNKARWILAEAVRGSGEDGGAENAAVNAEMMMHVFHTYSTYKPPFRRETTRLVDGPAPSSNGTAATAEVTQASVEMSGSSNPSPNTHDGHAQSGDVLTEVQMKTMPTFSRLPPQTPSDVIAETRALFDRITRDRQLSPEELRSSSVDGPLSGRFAHVELTSPLLNAYLSVFYRHASIESCREAFNSLLDRNRSSTEPTLQADNHTYINALERCTFAHGEDQRVATRWAEDVWEHWQAIEAEGVRSGKATVGTFARLIERAHSAMRRVLLGSGDIDGALALLRTFVSRYPPSALAQSPALSQMSSQHDPSSLEITSSTPTPPKSPTIQLFAKPPILSTRTVLTNPVPSASSLPTTARPLVRLTSSIGPRDDRVPPLIGFADVELLHTRLAERGRTKELGYLKWVCKSYESAIRKRRDAVLKAAPALSADVD
ncbi:hypothetical protein HYDPIDRAFT_177233 [Hydnomerulius pinastri MD-312]|uniref:Uncharacterized protein n=1 Tax=Hydnomerulius pinastri MD-312 TaxID=994086 RepID=A0A0C9W3S2_9AGAM|nr:hypothetical protein HYDPIDRAFT_177233 [Hydnomerulius pinastri MD-312]